MSTGAPGPLPPFNRRDEYGDWLVLNFFSPSDLAMSPEEYVARNAHLIGCFGFHEYKFRDQQLMHWVARVDELLSTEGAVERCREDLLTPDERARIIERLDDEF